MIENHKPCKDQRNTLTPWSKCCAHNSFFVRKSISVCTTINVTHKCCYWVSKRAHPVFDKLCFACGFVSRSKLRNNSLLLETNPNAKQSLSKTGESLPGLKLYDHSYKETSKFGIQPIGDVSLPRNNARTSTVPYHFFRPQWLACSDNYDHNIDILITYLLINDMSRWNIL